MEEKEGNKKIGWFRKYSIWFAILGVIGWIGGATQNNNDAALFWFIIMCISSYFYIKDNYLKKEKNIDKEKKEIENKSWFSKHPYLGGFLFIIMIGVFVGFFQETNNTININNCKPFIDSQMPNEFIFNEKYNMLVNWTDGTNINTLKNYRKVSGEGIWTSVETGNFKFRKGSKPGENANIYYIQTEISAGSSFDGSIEKGPEFYFEYNKKQDNSIDGTILPNKKFKIIPLNYNIEKIGNKYYFKFTEYTISSCININ